MATLDLDLLVTFAALLSDGSVLLELAVGDDDHLAQVTMPPSEQSRRLARDTTTTLEMDSLIVVAPGLAKDIDGFVSEVRRRLIERVARQN